MSELDPESNEEKEIDQVTIDVSCFIFPLAGETYEWLVDKINDAGFTYMENFNQPTDDPDLVDLADQA